MTKRVLVLVHESLIPPEKIIQTEKEIEFEPWATEYNVISGLINLKYDVKILGVGDDLKSVRDCIDSFKPQVVFNLLEEFAGNVLFDQNIVSYLELLKVPYTGCGPRGLILARDKALAKKIMKYHRVPTPEFFVFKKEKKIRPPKKLSFPIIVKCLLEDASYGISQASVVNSQEKLIERIQYIQEKLNCDAIAEEFVEGREFFVGILGNKRLRTLPILELLFENSPSPHKEFYSERAKWNKNYRIKKGIKTVQADVTPVLEKKIYSICKKVYKVLGLSGYARIDLRVTTEGEIFIIEANPNPNVGKYDELATSSLLAGISYSKLLKKIVSLA